MSLGKDTRQSNSLKLNCGIQLKVVCASRSHDISSRAQNIDVFLHMHARQEFSYWATHNIRGNTFSENVGIRFELLPLTDKQTQLWNCIDSQYPEEAWRPDLIGPSVSFTLGTVIWSLCLSRLAFLSHVSGCPPMISKLSTEINVQKVPATACPCRDNFRLPGALPQFPISLTEVDLSPESSAFSWPSQLCYFWERLYVKLLRPWLVVAVASNFLKRFGNYPDDTGLKPW